jgi:hypothetical protein
VAVLAVWFTIVLYKKGGIESFVAHDTGETRLVVWLGSRTDDLFGEVDGCVASRTFRRCWDGESRHLRCGPCRKCDVVVTDVRENGEAICPWCLLLLHSELELTRRLLLSRSVRVVLPIWASRSDGRRGCEVDGGSWRGSRVRLCKIAVLWRC